jgi:hypothetical protein
MDPRKSFLCKANRHLINDIFRPWGNQSPCPVCEYEKKEKFIQEIKKQMRKEIRII